MISYGLSLQSRFLSNVNLLKEKTGHTQIVFERLIGKNTSGNMLNSIKDLSEKIPITYHSVQYNLGVETQLNHDLLNKISNWENIPAPKWMSAHLAITGSHTRSFFGLFPIPRNKEGVFTAVNNINILKKAACVPIAIENITEYAELKGNLMSMDEFIIEIMNQANCELLLDLNNLFITFYNLSDFLKSDIDRSKKAIDKSLEFIQSIPSSKIREIHVAGNASFKNPNNLFQEKVLLDTHAHPLSDEVRVLLKETLKKCTNVAVTLEREANVPTVEIALNELLALKSLMEVEHVQK